MLLLTTEITLMFSVYFLMDEIVSHRFSNSIMGHCLNGQIS